MLQQPDENQVADALLAAIRQSGFGMLPMTKQAQQLKLGCDSCH